MPSDSLTGKVFKPTAFLGQWLVLALALAIVAGTAGINLYVEHNRTQKRETERLLIQSGIIAGNAIQNLRATDQVLAALRADMPATWPDPKLDHHLKALADAMPGVRTLAIVDAHGIIRAAGRPQIVGGDFSWRAYYKTPRAHPNPDTLYVSPPFRTVLGVYTLDVTRMIPGPDGGFGGVVTAVLDPQYFAPLLDAVLYASDMRASIVQGDGFVFLEAPHRAGVAGADLRYPGSFFTRHRASGRAISIFNRITGANGGQRLLIVRTIRPPDLDMDKPLFVGTSRSLEDIFARNRRDLRVQGALFALIALASALGLYAYQRRQREFRRQLLRDAEALAASERRFRTVADYTYDWEYWEGSAHEILYMSPSCERITGYGRDEFVTHPDLLLRIIHAEDRGRMEAHLHAIDDHEPGSVDFRIVRRDGEVRWIAHACVAVYDSDGRYNGRRVSNRELTERKTAEESIRYQAQHDTLTELPNRVLLFDRLQQALASARRNRADDPHLALIFLDLDKLKPINDSLGHAIGDLLLKEVAQRMKACVRESDTVARVGGDEFVVLLPAVDSRDAAGGVAEKIRQMLDQPMTLDGQTLRSSASVGVAFYPDDGDSEAQLLKSADEAMYQAKADGGNTVRFWDPGGFAGTERA